MGTPNTGQINIGTSPTPIVSNPNGCVTFINLGTVDVYLGGTGVSILTGILLPGVKGACLKLESCDDWYGVTASGTARLAFIVGTPAGLFFLASGSSGASLDTAWKGISAWSMADNIGTNPLVIFDAMSAPIGSLFTNIPSNGTEPTNVRIRSQAIANGQGLFDSNFGPTIGAGTIAFQKWRGADGGKAGAEFAFFGYTDANLHAVLLQNPPTTQTTIGFISSAGNWIAICGNGAASSSQDTGVPMDTNFHTFEMVFNGAAGVIPSVDFFIDGNKVASLTTTLPNAGTLVGSVFYEQGNAKDIFFEQMLMGRKV